MAEQPDGATPVEEEKVTYSCCFCGKECDEEYQVVLISNAGEKAEKAEVFFCHEPHFRAGLHETFKVPSIEEALAEEVRNKK